MNVPLWLIGVAGFIALLAVVAAVTAIVLIVYRNPALRKVAPPSNLTIDVDALELDPLNSGGPTIEVYGVPARLVVFVLAPAGRNVELPDARGIRSICERILPGLTDVVDFQRPVFRRWENQLSSQGFVRSFFANMMLPGDGGIGTPWCSVAGKFESGQGNMVAGFVFLAERENSLGQIEIERTGMWHDVLRIRN